MLTPRQARQGSALLSIIVSMAVTATAITPTVQAEGTVKATEGDRDRGLDQAHGRPSAGFEPPADAEAIAARRQSLNEYLVRDRTATIELANAARAIAEDRTADAIAILQTLLDSPADVFLWEEGRSLPISARSSAADLLRKLPPAALAEYERRYGADARQLLNEFKLKASAHTQRTLLRRFEFTAAGAEVHLLTGQRALDHGEFVEAARAFERFYRHPLAGQLSDGLTRLRAEAAAELVAASGVRVELPDFDWNQPIEFREQTRIASAWRDELRPVLRRMWTQTAEPDRNWRVAFGNAQSHRPTSATAPTLAPLWTAPHDESAADEIDGLQTVAFESAPAGSELLASWQQTRRERRLPSAGANFALVDRGQVLVRDFSGITSRDLETGEVRWQFPCIAGLRRQAAAVQSATKAPATADAVAASQLFNEFFAQNSVLGMLSSDGRRVYCVDLLPEAAPVSDEHAQAANRLVALALDVEGTAEGEPVWEASADRWYFLGPPLPIGDQLFIVAERDSLVALLALDAETGAVMWNQPISLVDARIADDPQRARQACCPVQAGDLVVCPTQLGTVVGVSIRDGALEWVYSYEEATGPSQPWRKTRAFDREFGSPEYPNLPLVVGGAVIVLAPQSSNVHCIDLQTGEPRWTPQDRGSALYAAAAVDDLVLLVGPRECTARRISDGSQAWQQAIAPSAGRGLVAGDHFVLSTEEGHIVSLEIRTGRLIPDLLPRLPQKRSVALRTGDGIVLTDALTPDPPLPLTGNLLSCGPYIVACSPAGVSVYPQAGVALAELRDRSSSQPLGSAAWLERGELELRLGDGDAAIESLRKAVNADGQSRTRIAAETRLRELLYIKLADGTEPDRMLAELDPLCRHEERSRFLIHRLQQELHTDNVSRALQTAAEIARLDSEFPDAMDACGKYVSRADRRAAAALVRHARSGSHDDSGRWSLATSPLVEALAITAEGSAHLESVRVTRAARIESLISARRLQAAELLLLAETRQADPAVRQVATQRLATLWRTNGLPREAEQLLDELSGPGTSSSSTPALAEAVIEQHDCQPQDVTDHSCNGFRLVELLQRNREYSRQPPGSRVLFDRGLQGTPDRKSFLSVVDVVEPRLVADLELLEPRVWRSGDATRYDAGHFLPIASGDVHGVSLLEGRILWSVSPEAHFTGDKPLLGPFGPEYCILQSHETVTALDPHDGQVLWRRSDLPFDCGLASSAEGNGMFADDQALVIFDEDHITYRVLDPRSGELLTSGVLEPSSEPRRRGWGFGRRLLYITQGDAPHLRLWDPLQESFLLDIPCTGRCLVDPGLGSGLAVILNGQQLSILDTRRAVVTWSTELSPSDAAAARQVRGIAERDRYVIHVEQDVNNSPSSQATHDIGGAPNIPVGGTLYVVDRWTGDDWSRSMPRCNLLLFPTVRTPVLVTLGRTKEGVGDQSAFVVEVLDAANGHPLASRNDLTRVNKLLVHSRYDAERNTIQLLGDQSQIEIHLVPKKGTGTGK